MTKKKILYMGNFSFPVMYAPAKHVLGIGNLLREIGYEVIYLGMDRKTSANESISNTKSEYNGFEYYCINYPKKYYEWLNIFARNKRVLNFFRESNLLNEVECVIFYDRITALISNYLFYRYFKKKNIKVICERQDWFTYNIFTLKGMFKTIENIISRFIVEPNYDGCIAISSYFAKLCKKQRLYVT